MLQPQNRETKNSTWKAPVSSKIINYDDERDKIVFHNTTQNLQDQDHSVQDQDGFFWYQTGLVLRPTISDHITDVHIHKNAKLSRVVQHCTRIHMAVKP